MECFDLIHPYLNFLLTNQFISVYSGGRALGGHRKVKALGTRQLGELRLGAGG